MDLNITLVIQFAAFFAVSWMVMKFGWPHIMAAIEERQQKIAEGLAAADRSQQDLARAEEKVAEALKEARAKANEIIDQAHQRANQIIDQAKEDAVAEANRQKALAESEIAAAANRVACAGCHGEIRAGGGVVRGRSSGALRRFHETVI